MRSRVMYIENKSDGLANAGRIGRVTFSKTGATLRYGGRSLQSLKGSGFKANYFDIDTGEAFWISGPRRDGADGLYGRVTQPADVDADVAEAYWRDIRKMAPPAPSTWPEPPKGADKRSISPVDPEPLAGQGRAATRLARRLARPEGGAPG